GAKTRQPARVVLSRSGKLPPNARIFTDHLRNKTRVYRNQALATVLADLGAKDTISVLIEGGGNVLGQALDERLIDKVQIYIAPRLTGGPIPAFAGQGASRTNEAAHLERVNFEEIGGDLCVTGYPKYAAAAAG